MFCYDGLGLRAASAWSLLRISVLACWKISAGAREIRSLHSLQGEIAEIDACVGSLLNDHAQDGGPSDSPARPNDSGDIEFGA